MASSLLCRSLAALRSIRSSALVAPDPRIYRNPFFKRTIFSGRKIFRSLVCPTIVSIRCSTSVSTGLRTPTSAIHSPAQNEPVVSADWLLANLREPDVKVLDASWYMPHVQRRMPYKNIRFGYASPCYR